MYVYMYIICLCVCLLSCVHMYFILCVCVCVHLQYLLISRFTYSLDALDSFQQSCSHKQPTFDQLAPTPSPPISCVSSFRAVKLLVLNLAKCATTMGKTRAKRHPSMQSIPQDPWFLWFLGTLLQIPLIRCHEYI